MLKLYTIFSMHYYNYYKGEYIKVKTPRVQKYEEKGPPIYLNSPFAFTSTRKFLTIRFNFTFYNLPPPPPMTRQN